MAKGYYPDYYARKQRRNRQFKIISWTILAIFCIAIGVTAGYYVVNAARKYYATRQTGAQPGVSPALADERDQLAAQSRLDDAARTASPAPAGEANTALAEQPPDLATLPYEASFPQVAVGLVNATNEGAAEPASTDTAAATGETPPEAGATGEAANTTVVQTPEAPREEPKPAKPAEEKPKEQPKPEKPAEKPKEQPKPADQVPTAPESGAKSFEYRVYAGAFTSKDSADQAAKDLSAHGLTGKISFQEPNYTVLVAVLDNFDAAQALQRKVVQSGFPKAYTTKKSKSK